MVLDKKVVLPIEDASEVMDHLRSETEAMLATSRKLMLEMDELMERMRALKAAHDVLLVAAREKRRKKSSLT